MTCPSPALRITRTKNSAGVFATALSTLHRDGLGSVYTVTDATGHKSERATYRPYGEQSETVFGTAALPEAKGSVTIEMTATGKLLEVIGRAIAPFDGKVPNSVWDAASARFAAGATSATSAQGTFVRGMSTLNRIEKAILDSKGLEYALKNFDF